MSANVVEIGPPPDEPKKKRSHHKKTAPEPEPAGPSVSPEEQARLAYVEAQTAYLLSALPQVHAAIGLDIPPEQTAGVASSLAVCMSYERQRLDPRTEAQWTLAAVAAATYGPPLIAKLNAVLKARRAAASEERVAGAKDVTPAS